MGWFVAYEICFDRYVCEWDDDTVRLALDSQNIDSTLMYLTDHSPPKAVALVYSGNTIEDVMKALHNLYRIPMKTKLYDANDYKYVYPPSLQQQA